ncbi:glycosyltransferase [Enterococcus asini]|uniref:glycosyltransferase n=1 Tax=Enterococcus asini TaxID=57732 RepID=UPI001E353899|nr:glycosyltransferase [Enterococcus asini]MDT2762720.1 glycosyltransferase [Enterococcus asini]
MAFFLMGKKIYIVIVLYKQKWVDIPSRDCIENLVHRDAVEMLIYDNSPEEQTASFFEEQSVTYIHDSMNPGLASAYNQALSFAKDFEWLVLLDQDTKLSSSFFYEIAKAQPTDQVVSLVPQIFSGNQQISPVFSNQYVSKKSIYPKEGSYSEIMAINSASVLRVSFLKEIGGFNEEFPLDFLDHWLYWKINDVGKKVQILPVKIQHSLSVLDYTTLKFTRYQSILAAERLFYGEYAVTLKKQHRRHLLKRALKQFLTVTNRRFWRCTIIEWWHLIGGKR